MRQIKCPDCNETCIKHGVLKSGSQRWFCKHCKVAFTVKINNLSKELSLFLNWLFSTDIQADMPGKGRTFRRKTAKFWLYNKCWGDTTTVSLPTLFFLQKISIQDSHTLQ